MTIRLILLALPLFAFVSCKKSDNASSNDALLVDFSVSGNTGVTTFPCTVKLVSKIPEIADVVTWTFSDSTTATGDSVTHQFNSYGEFVVNCSAQKGTRVGSLTKGVPVSLYHKFQIRAIDILQTEPYGPGGVSWDDFGNKPDLAYRFTMPDGVTATTADGNILFDKDTGTLIVSPAVYITRFDGDVNVEVLDVDTGMTPKYVTMSTSSFYIGDYVPQSGVYPTHIQLQKNLTKVDIKIAWIQ